PRKVSTSETSVAQKRGGKPTARRSPRRTRARCRSSRGKWPELRVLLGTESAPRCERAILAAHRDRSAARPATTVGPDRACRTAHVGAHLAADALRVELVGELDEHLIGDVGERGAYAAGGSELRDEYGHLPHD